MISYIFIFICNISVRVRVIFFEPTDLKMKTHYKRSMQKIATRCRTFGNLCTMNLDLRLLGCLDRQNLSVIPVLDTRLMIIEPVSVWIVCSIFFLFSLFNLSNNSRNRGFITKPSPIGGLETIRKSHLGGKLNNLTHFSYYVNMNR